MVMTSAGVMRAECSVMADSARPRVPPVESAGEMVIARDAAALSDVGRVVEPCGESMSSLPRLDTRRVSAKIWDTDCSLIRTTFEQSGTKTSIHE